MFKKITKDQQEFSSSSLTSESLDNQTKETQVRLWLNQNYPQDQRSQIRYLEISGKGLVGSLDLTDFVNLEELYCYDNQLTGIKFADSSLDKLRVLHVGGNNFPEQNLTLFSHLVKLEVLNLENNNFVGSLRPLENLVNLQSLDISDTNIDSGLIYLSDKLEGLFCQVEKQTSCQKIKDELKDKLDKGSESLVREEAFRKKEKFFELVNNIYQALILNENGTSGTKLRYEKFGVIAGSEKEELKFYSTFFTGNNKFKKGEIYELSTPGNFVQDSAEIIQGVNSGGYEFEKVAPSLAIKELWEEKESNIEKLNALEEDLQEKKNNINRISEELISKKREFDDLQSRFNNLQIEKNKLKEEKEKISEELNSTKTSLQKKEEELVSSKGEATQLQNQAKLIQEKEDLSNQAKKEKESLSEQFKKERRSKQLLIETLEDLRGQKLKETIEENLAEKKRELEKLETAIVEKLGSNQKSLLENFLEKQEDFDTALFDDVSQTSRSFLRAKEKLQDARVKLVAKVDSEEVEELCKIQSEIGKLEASQKQWEKMEDQQRKEEQEQYESYTETPPTPPKNN
ncbi:9101_t:CDS:2 [Entrophospora sp. SA101]|nr:3942_t:CDS:2 [Entrophospora sp. SA101]CAJ0844972.1 9101_t:CDS:2 [Entrophospora sp. SA101]